MKALRRFRLANCLLEYSCKKCGAIHRVRAIKGELGMLIADLRVNEHLDVAKPLALRHLQDGRVFQEWVEAV